MIIRRIILLFYLFTSLGSLVNAQTISNSDSDTLKHRMAEVLITSERNSDVILISQPQTTADSNTFIQFSPTNVSEALSKLPGVSYASTGPGVSRPVIRGLSGTRVLTALDGLPLETLPWDEEHGLEVNEADFEHVSVIKGASTLLYGPEAIGGVLLFDSPDQHFIGTRGNAKAGFYSNGLGFSGKFSVKSMSEYSKWNISAGTNSFSDYRYGEDVRAFNTRFWQNGLKAGYGFIEPWGNVDLSYRLNFSLYGILDPFELENAGAEAGEEEEYPREFEAPYHQVMNHRFQLNSGIKISDKVMKVAADFEYDDRAEYEPKNGDPKNPEKFIGLASNTINLRGVYPFIQTDKYNTNLGVQAKLTDTKNNADFAFVPNSNQTEIGVFAVTNYSLSFVLISTGLRWDVHNLKTTDYGGKFSNILDNSYSSLSGSFGLTFFPFEKTKTSLNYSHGFRPPNVNELASEGYRPETGRYEYGNSNLGIETVNSFDFNLQQKIGISELEISLFYEMYNNFISLNGPYYSPLNSNASVFYYRQTETNLKGVELSWQIGKDWGDAKSNFLFEFSTVKDDLALSDKINLPSPADKLSLTVSQSWKNEGMFKNPVVTLQWQRYLNIWNDDRLAYNGGNGWSIVNINVETQLDVIPFPLTIGLSGRNILNTRYIDPLSRIARFGVANPGVSVNMYFRVPFSI